MPTPLDKALNSKNLFVGFTALITAATAWSIWGQDLFPATQPPSSSSNPSDWTEAELRSWLEKRNLPVLSTESREDMLARVQNILANIRPGRG